MLTLMLPEEIRADRSLFWDAAPDSIDPEGHAPYVIARVLNLGTLAQVHALQRFYGRARLSSFFLDGGLRQVDDRTAAFWLLVLGLDRETCERRSSAPPRPASWNA